MAIDSAQKRSIVVKMGFSGRPNHPTGTVDEMARGGVLGRYYFAAPVSTGRRHWRKLRRRVID